MLKIATLVWIVLGATLAGSLVLVVVSVPALNDRGMTLIPYAAAAGFVLAAPFAALIARKIQSAVATRA